MLLFNFILKSNFIYLFIFYWIEQREIKMNQLDFDCYCYLDFFLFLGKWRAIIW